jgi:hypothetical protein
MSAAKLLDRLMAKQAEKPAAEFVAREYSETPPIPPADGLQRRGAFIMPTRETLPAYAVHFDAKAVCELPQTDPQTERIRRLAALVTADELLAAHRKIKPLLKA